MRNFEITAKAIKSLKKLPKKDAHALADKIAAYSNSPEQVHAFAKTMTGMENTVRIRHGQWRAIGEWNGASFALFTVYKVGHRREIYR